MKKQLTAIFLVFALLLTMAGCSAVQKLDAVEERAEAKLEIAEEKLEDSLRKAASPTQAAAPTIPTAAATEFQPAATESLRELTKEQAQKIALDYLGFTADQVSRLRTEFEIDDGIPQFDVSFYQGDWEYEFEIHGETGKIISYDKDHKYD